jgi:hypothetical protein
MKKEVKITNIIKLLYNKCIKIYNNLTEKLDDEENKIKDKVFNFLESYSSYKIRYKKILSSKLERELIKNIEKYINDLQKNITKKEYVEKVRRNI